MFNGFLATLQIRQGVKAILFVLLLFLLSKSSGFQLNFDLPSRNMKIFNIFQVVTLTCSLDFKIASSQFTGLTAREIVFINFK